MSNTNEKRGEELAEMLGILPAKKHEYLTKEDYYESQSVGTKARSDKICEHCGKSIPKGQPHTVHKFYGDGEYPSYPTHKGCDDEFVKSLRDENDPAE